MLKAWSLCQVPVTPAPLKAARLLGAMRQKRGDGQNLEMFMESIRRLVDLGGSE